MKFILGRKIGMTQIWKDEYVVPITKIEAGPCLVTQVKDQENDGYSSLQIGFGRKKDNNVRKPQMGHLRSLKEKPRYLREFRFEAKDGEEIKVGDRIRIDTFEVGDKVDIAGTSKGKGFQGVVKRHGFSGAKATHGTKDQLRMPGSAGAMGESKIIKGKRMPGRMGGERVTAKNLEIIEIDVENNILMVKGALPGPNNGFVAIKAQGDLKISSDEEKEEKVDETEDGAKVDVETKEEVQDDAKEDNEAKEEVKEKEDENAGEEKEEDRQEDDDKNKEDK